MLVLTSTIVFLNPLVNGIKESVPLREESLMASNRGNEVAPSNPNLGKQWDMEDNSP